MRKAQDGATLNVPKEETGRRGGCRGGPFSRARVGSGRRECRARAPTGSVPDRHAGPGEGRCGASMSRGQLSPEVWQRPATRHVFFWGKLPAILVHVQHTYAERGDWRPLRGPVCLNDAPPTPLVAERRWPHPGWRLGQIPMPNVPGRASFHSVGTNRPSGKEEGLTESVPWALR